MADNVSVTAGSGTTIAADEVPAASGVFFQRVKVGLGADGTANDWTAGAGVNGTGVARVTVATDDLLNTNLGGVTESAPGTDTASSGLNGRLQRIAQRLTALIAQIPTALGRTTMAGSLSVTTASDDGLTGATNETAPVSDTAASGLNGRLQRIAQNLTTVNSTLQSVNTQLPSTVSGMVQTTITRPANATPYTAGDVIGGAITIATGMTSGQRIMLAGMDLQYQVASVPSGMTTLRLHLYNVTPPSAIADNSPWTFGSSDRASYLGYVDFPAVAALGTGTTTVFSLVEQLNKLLQLSGSANLFGYLVTTGGFTPAGNSEVLLLRTGFVGF